MYTAEEQKIIKENYPLYGAKHCLTLLNNKNNRTLYNFCFKNKLKANPGVARKNAASTRKSRGFIYKDFSKYQIHPNVFMKPDTPEAAYLLGFLWADGHIRPKIGGICTVFLTSDFQSIRNVFEKVGQWRIYHRESKNKQPSTSIETNNRPASDFLIKHGYTSKDCSPDSILEIIPENLRHYWWRGLIDGDGCFYRSRRRNGTYSGGVLSITSCYSQDWTYCFNLAKKLNVSFSVKLSSHIVNGVTHSSSTIRCCNKPNIKTIGEYIYQGYPKDNIGFPRKYEKYLLIVQ